LHIADGVVSAPIWLGSLGGTVGIASAVLRRTEARAVPKIAVMTSAFFVASLIHVPLGPTSVHLTLSGLVGLVLGPAAFVAVVVGLTLQAVLFQHGGITSIGVNSLIMGIPSVVVWWLFCRRYCAAMKEHAFVIGVLAGSTSTLMSVLMLVLALVGTGGEFVRAAQYAVIAHLPIVAVEAVVTGSALAFLVKVKPEVIALSPPEKGMATQD
jgi:cobalt/nickel transport system permease protein